MSSGQPIRAHLAVLVLATALPLIGLIASGIYGQARLEAEQAAEQALQAARSAATEGERRLQRARDLLAYLSRQARVGALDPQRCDPIFETFTALFPGYTNLLTVRSDGARVCSAVTPTAGAPAKVDPALYLAETLRSRAFTVGRINRGIFTGRWILIVAHPLPEVAGEIPGIVAMSIDLARLRLVPETAELPPGAEARIVAADGTVIAGGGDSAGQSVGQSLAGAGWLKRLTPGQVTTGRLHDDAGAERFFAAVPVAATDWQAVVAIPVDAVYAAVRSRAQLSAVVTVAALALVAALAYLIGRGTARPVEAIAAAARRATTADGARPEAAVVAADLNRAPREVRALAEDFVAMLDTRTKAEQALRAGEERLQAVIDNLAEGLIICGPDGRQVKLNRAARAAHGLAEGEQPSAEVFRAAHEILTLQGQALPGEEWPLRRLLRGDSVTGLELRMRRRDGAWERVFSYGGALLRDPAGHSLAFLTLTDITQRKRAEAQVHELNQALEQRVQERTAQLAAKSKELESFCYSVSHDLKAPLRGIDGYSRLLMEDCSDKLGDEGRTFIGNVRLATRQMTELIEDLLAYSRQERRTLVAAQIKLRSFVAEQLARQRLDGVELVVDIDDLLVAADPESLAVALRNLVDNACKFSARAEHPAITLRGHASQGRCVLSVQDNGSGFDMRYHDKIFEIFQRLHRAEDYPGTGIGLALVRKAMDRIGGRVWARSAPGAGATFYLEIPLVNGPASVAAASATAQGQQHG